jgi:hypothetical protein
MPLLCEPSAHTPRFLCQRLLANGGAHTPIVRSHLAGPEACHRHPACQSP